MGRSFQITMFIPLLLFTCSFAQELKVPSYGDIRDDIHKAVKILYNNVLSMDGTIPFMNDPRRHYTEIISVVYTLAIQDSATTDSNYYRDYQYHLNNTGHIGVIDPQGVIDGTRRLIADTLNSIDEVLKLVDSYGVTSRDNDKEIHEELKKIKSERAQMAYIATGLAAAELNRAHINYFAPRSKHLSAHKFVITGSKKLRKLVLVVSNFYRVLFETQSMDREITFKFQQNN